MSMSTTTEALESKQPDYVTKFIQLCNEIDDLKLRQSEKSDEMEQLRPAVKIWLAERNGRLEIPQQNGETFTLRTAKPSTRYQSITREFLLNALMISLAPCFPTESGWTDKQRDELCARLCAHIWENRKKIPVEGRVMWESKQPSSRKRMRANVPEVEEEEDV